MKNVVIYGLGGHAEMTYSYMKYDQGFNIKAFTVEEQYITKKELFGVPVIPYKNLLEIYPPGENELFIAVGPHKLNTVRENLYNEIRSMGYSLVNCICKEAMIPHDCKMGDSIFIDPATGLHPFVELGNNVHLIDTKIAHHSKVGNHVFISSVVLGGHVIIEDNVFIGMNSVIKEEVVVGRGSIIGMGCVIKEDVPPYSVYSQPGTRRRNIDSRRLALF